MMTTLYTFTKISKKLAGLLLLVSTLSANAALTDISETPLANSSTSDVLPNLMYVLDDSGSMAWDYMPDYVNDNNKCKSTGTSGDFSASCAFGDPPYNTSAYNSIYYNPANRYQPPKIMQGTPSAIANMPEMTAANTANWTQVPQDAFGVQGGTAKDSLVPDSPYTGIVGYLDRIWCNTNSPSAANKLNPAICKQNTQYNYPNNTGTASTSFNQANTLRGYPYYYNVTAGEHCTDKNMTSCVVSSTPVAATGHVVPSYLRWCNSSARTTCRAKFQEQIGSDTTTNYTFAKWNVVSGSKASGTIRIDAQSPANSPAASPVALSITSITVDGVSIIPAVPSPALTITDTTSSTQRNTLAANIASAINAHASTPEFVATASNNVVTVSRDSFEPYTGTISVATSSHTTAVVTGNKATGWIEFTRVGRTSNPANTVSLTGLNISGVGILSGSGTCGSVTSNLSLDNTGNRANFAGRVRDRINSCTSSPRDYTATTSGLGSRVTITAVSRGTASNGSITGAPGSSGDLRYNTSALAGGTNDTPSKTYTLPTTITSLTGGSSVVNNFQRVDITPATTTYPKASGRTDCAGSTCTYDEEMTNFANWYAYYRTRMQMMKSSTALAFSNIDSRYRVGFITIHNKNYLPVAQYLPSQKNDWYTKLLTANPNNGGTPLRGAISRVGRIFAGQGSSIVSNSSDPIQYACQQNYALLTTDGYWNSYSSTTSNEPRQLNGTSNVGNTDGGTTPKPLYEGSTVTTDTLADVTKYYFDTDLRTDALNNCDVTVAGNTVRVCDDGNTASPGFVQQRMQTMTLGLGVDGVLSYSPTYETDTAGDFFEIKQGTREWPVTVADKQTTVDDLWHAAVNGRGKYFSATNPTDLAISLNNALESIDIKQGAGAAAATSTLNPVAGNNFSYVASYTTKIWTGNLEARQINVANGDVNAKLSNWCLEDPDPALGVTCTGGGTLKNSVSATTDTRNIYMNVGGGLASFTYANLVTAGKNANFENTFLTSNLSQVNTSFIEAPATPVAMDSTKQALMTGASLVNYLRGNRGYENRSSNAPPSSTVDTRIYRLREAVLGDLIDATPVYVGAPSADFSDPGYGSKTTAGTFKYTQASRAGTVYIGSNDGMLHAINAADGTERWAYIPTAVLDKMWKLADERYTASPSLHTYYVNGDIVVNDICAANCSNSSTAVWKTILVAGLNSGGKGYFALDITNPTSPSLLWEFDSSSLSGALQGTMGLSYGNPIITKKNDGTWVVVLTSGYNNVDATTAASKGKGYLYVLNANSGALISSFSTGVGDATTPSGLAKINGHYSDATTNNLAQYIYGGDLLGNVWRFDINSAASASNPFKVAELKDASGVGQPITTRPELSEASGKRLLFVGTGRYLSKTIDIDATPQQQQSIYAFTDSEATTLDNIRSNTGMKLQEVKADTTDSEKRVVKTAQTVNLVTDRGWYIDFPDAGERQNVPAQLVFGTLLLPTVVPTSSSCSPGGTGWLYGLDYKTGLPVSGTIAASRTSAPIVGINVIYINGKPVVNIVTADNPTPKKPKVQPEFGSATESGFGNRRAIWRELIEK